MAWKKRAGASLIWGIARGILLLYMLTSMCVFMGAAKVYFPQRQPLLSAQETRQNPLDIVPDTADSAAQLPDWAATLQTGETIRTGSELARAVNAAQIKNQPLIAEIEQDIILEQPLRIEAPIKLYLRGNGETVISCGDFRHFEIFSSDVALYFENIILSGGEAAGGIQIAGRGEYGRLSNITIAGMQLTGCTAPAAQAVGGGIFAEMVDELTLTDCMIQNCTAQAGGGGIYLAQAQHASISGSSRVQDCQTAFGVGAGIAVYDSGLSVSGNTRVEGNWADCDIWSEAARGGGIYSSGSSLIVREQTAIIENKACFGGGVYLAGGSMEIGDNVFFEGNSALFRGGGIFSEGLLEAGGNARMQHNLAGEHGAGIFAAAGTLSLQGNMSFGGNIALEEGGALWVGYEASVMSTGANPVFEGNIAARGNTVYFQGGIPEGG